MKLWSKQFVLIMLTHFFVYTSIYILMSTLPLYMQHIGGNKVMAGVISSIFTFTGFFTRPWFGKLLDTKGRKIIMLIGIVLILVTTVSYAAADFILSLLILRMLQGIGWSAASTATSTIASDLIPASRRFEGMGYFGMAASVAMAIGPALGLSLIKHDNYKLMFLSTSLFIVLGLALGLTISPSSSVKAKSEEKIKNKGSILEKTALGPSLVFLLVSMTYSGIATFLPSYAIYKHIGNIGLFFTIYAITLFLTRPVTGKLADKIGTAKVILPGTAFLMTALIIIVRAVSLKSLLIASVFYGIGFGSVQPILNAQVVSLAPDKRRGAANATFLAAMDLGMGIGALAWGVISQRFGYVYIYIISILLALIAGLIHFILSKVEKSQKEIDLKEEAV